MKSNQLRVGNIVDFKGNLQKGQDAIIEANDIGVIAMQPDLIDFTPINEEWLLKFGFTNITDKHEDISSLDLFIHSGTIHFFANKEDDYSDVTLWWVENGEPSESYIVRLQYVHQLQNLYYALTDEELTTN